jgi:hypothetical protein
MSNPFQSRRGQTKKDVRQAVYVTSRRVRTTMVVVGKQWVLHNQTGFVCSLRYPACNAHAPFCHLRPAPVYNIFPHYLTKGMIFGKMLLDIKMWILIFCTTSVCNIFHSKKNWVRWSKMYIGLHAKFRLLLADFNETGIFTTDFRKKNNQISNFMKLHPVAAELFHTDRRTDRHDEANSRFS